MAPYCRQLPSMSKRDKESFKEYAQRWRETDARVEPPIIGKELTDMFTDTLPSIYWEIMLGGVTSSFADLVTIGELVEEGLKSGKVAQEESHSSAPRRFVHKKKEGETNVVFNNYKGPCQVGRSNQNYVATVALVINSPSVNNQVQNQQRAQASRNNNFQFREKVSFDPILMPYRKLYPTLIQRGLVVPKGYKTPPSTPLPAWYNTQKHCKFQE